jgi:hypothetical protein
MNMENVKSRDHKTDAQAEQDSAAETQANVTVVALAQHHLMKPAPKAVSPLLRPVALSMIPHQTPMRLAVLVASCGTKIIMDWAPAYHKSVNVVVDKFAIKEQTVETTCAQMFVDVIW